MATRRGPDNSVRFSISGQIAGVTWANVFWCMLTTTGTPSQAQLDTWLGTVQAAYKAQFAASIGTIVSFQQAQAQMFLPGGLVLPSIVAMTGFGTGTVSAAVKSHSCSVLSWQTGVYWKGGKPRTYLPVPPDVYVADPNSLTSTAVSTLATAAAGWRSNLNSTTSGAITGTKFVLMSFRSQKEERPVPVPFDVISAKVHPGIATQRRRLGRWQP